MRRMLMLMGVALLAFPLVAFGQVKVRTRTGGFPIWDIPAGEKLAKGFKAPVKAGPFTLGFHTQIEMDFESNNNFDFSSDVGDGHANNPVALQGARAAAVGLATAKDTIKGEAFLTEIRFGMDAVAGPITTHLVFEQTAIVNDRTSENQPMNLERAWGDVDLGYFNVRYGIELFSLEPTFMLYGDDDPWLSIYKNYGDWAWMVRYHKRVDSDEDRRGNSDTTLTPGASNTSAAGDGRANDTDILMASVEIPVANPLGPGTLSIQPFYVFDSDKRFRDGKAVDASGRKFDGDINAHWIGASLKGNIGPVKSTFSGVYAFGTDKTGFNGLNSATGLPRSDVDIRAWQFFGDLAYPLPGAPLTITVGAYLASGDDDPFDDEANGWLGVAHNSEIFNGRDIFVDVSEDTGSGLTVRLQREDGAGIPTSGIGEAVTLTGDDEAIVEGLSSFNNVHCRVAGAGCSAAAVAAGDHPTRGVQPTPGSNISQLDPFSVNNRSHPGIAITNLGLHYKILDNLTASTDYQHIRYLKTDGYSPVGPSRPVGILDTGTSIDGEFGNQFSFRAVWKPAKFLVVDPQIVFLVPGDGVKDLTGEDDTAWSFRVGMRWNF